jgi:aldose sugar dehydrogenase
MIAIRPASALLGILLVTACNETPPQTRGPTQVSKVEPAGGQGEATAPRVGPDSSGAPVETAPRNAPELTEAFRGQTRAPGVRTTTQFKVDDVATGLKQPWALAFLPDARMLVTEKHDGRLLLVSRDGKSIVPVEGVPAVVGKDQSGLLDVALAPDYSASKWLYLSYVEPREGGNGLAVARARLREGAKPRLEQLKVIFQAQPTLDSTKHAGGRLAFSPDGFLFITLGERSIMEGRVQAQKLDSHFGKVARLHADGTVPSDNPFVGRAGARPEIWSLGHRNALAATFDARSRLWLVEMGPRGGDELNLVAKGKDYGWPTIGYGEEYSGKRIHQSSQAEGMEQPVYYWDPVISPGAVTIYTGDAFPEWKGSFLIAGLSSKALIRLTLEGDRVTGEERLLTDREERLREVVQGPDGGVYLLTDGSDGKLIKVTPR